MPDICAQHSVPLTETLKCVAALYSIAMSVAIDAPKDASEIVREVLPDFLDVDVHTFLATTEYGQVVEARFSTKSVADSDPETVIHVDPAEKRAVIRNEVEAACQEMLATAFEE